MSAQADGVRVLITGGTRWLGAAMAAALLDGGAAVAVTGRDASRAEAVARNRPALRPRHPSRRRPR